MKVAWILLNASLFNVRMRIGKCNVDQYPVWEKGKSYIVDNGIVGKLIVDFLILVCYVGTAIGF